MAAPTRIGRFEILRELGRGAMGLVYLAHDPRIDRQVAIKTIQRDAADPEVETEDSKQRFLREAQAAGKLIHPGIVTIFDVGDDQGLSYIAMEYIEGRTLDCWTKPGSLLPPERSVDLIAQASRALDYAHQHGVVHRDIKPANLMVVGERQLKITDFGLAKNPSASITNAGTLVGTPNYMSPEQIMGKPLDGRSDLFSLAVVLYELLTGERPFGGDTISTIIYRVLHELPKPPEALNPSLPLLLSQVIARAMEKEPAGRFQTGEELAAALQGYLDAVQAPQMHTAPAIRKSGVREVPARRADRESKPETIAAGPAPRPASVPTFHSVPGVAAASKRSSSGGRAARSSSGMKTAFIAVLALAGLGFAAWQYRDDLARLLERAPGRGTEGREPTSGSTGAGSVAPPNAASLPPVETPAPLPQGEVVSIRVATRPPGGKILLDDKEVTAGTIVLPKDDTSAHTLVGVDDCKEGKLTIKAGASESAEIDLDSPRLRPVQITSEPAGAVILLDGKETDGHTPAEITLSACEPHTIGAKLAGYKDASRSFEAKTDWNAVAPVSLALTKVPDGYLTLKTPYPVEILEGTRKIGASGSRVKLSAGRHTLTFVNRDLFVEATADVQVPPDGAVSPSVDLPSVGQLTVLANPGDGTVFVNGRKVGTLPFIDQPLAEGTYTLKYVLDSGPSAERVVLIVAGKTSTEKFKLN